MKQGMTLIDLATELERQQTAKQDYVVDTRDLSAHTNGQTTLAIQGYGEFPLTEHAHGQIAGHLAIPKPYYDRMRERLPDLLDHNINTWLADEGGATRRLVRAMDGQARAFLSDRYRRLDNYDLLGAITPTLIALRNEGHADLRVDSAAVTDTRLYLKLVFPSVHAAVSVGDVVQAGVVISNSEIGAGALRVENMVFRLVCLNGAIMGSALAKTHLGRAMDEGVANILTDEALAADDQAFWLKVRDVVRHSLSQESLDETVAAMQAAKDEPVAQPMRAVEVLAQNHGLLLGEMEGVTQLFLEEKDYSRYGLMNAVTAFSQTVESYDRATELESLGGQVLTLAPAEWRKVALAA